MSKSESKGTKIAFAVRENLEFALLFIMGIVMIVVGIALLWFGHDIEFMIAAGIGFAVASYVGIRMMVGTREVAHKLYERFNDQNTILSSHTDTLKEIVQIYEKIDQRAEKRAEEFKKEMAQIHAKIVDTRKDTMASLEYIMKRLER